MLGLAILLATSFSVLLWAGGEIFRAAPPIPEQLVAQDGKVVYTRADIEQGRQVWQSIGGMQLGSIWGHVLGSFALKRAQTQRVRLMCYLLALLVFGFMLSIARSHHPLGALTGWVN